MTRVIVSRTPASLRRPRGTLDGTAVAAHRVAGRSRADADHAGASRVFRGCFAAETRTEQAARIEDLVTLTIAAIDAYAR
jgi:hypothetical protein